MNNLINIFTDEKYSVDNISDSVSKILVNPDDRTLWIFGMPYGNRFIPTNEHGIDTENLPNNSEIFNDLNNNKAFGDFSHAEGLFNIVNNEAEHACGKYNLSTVGRTIFSIGIGNSDSDRGNAIEVTSDGKVYILDIGNYNNENPNPNDVSFVISQIIKGIGLDSSYVFQPSGHLTSSFNNAKGAIEKLDNEVYTINTVTIPNLEKSFNQKIDDLDTKIDTEIGNVNKRIDGITDDFNNKIDNVEQSIQELDDEFNDYKETTGEQIATIIDNVNTNALNIGKLGGRLTTAEGEIDTLQSDVKGINTRLTTAEGEIDTLQNDVKGINTRLKTAEGEIDALKTNVGKIGDRLTTAEGEIDTLQGKVNGIDGRLTTAEDKITNLENNKASKDELKNELKNYLPLAGGTITGDIIANNSSKFIGISTQVLNKSNNQGLSFWSGTEAEYNAIQTKDPNTVYIISDAHPDGSLSLSTSSLSFTAAGESKQLTINTNESQSWSLSVPEGFTSSVPSGTGTTTVTINAVNNTTTSKKTGNIVVTSGSLSATCSVTQEAGTHVYEQPVINLSYPVISAAGGTVNPNMSYSQKWTWNGVPGSGGTSTTGASVSYSGTSVNASNGSVTAGSKGTTVSGVTTVTTATVSVSLNGKNGTKSATVQQEANVVTDPNHNPRITAYGTPSVSIGSGLTASGGSATVSHSVTNTQTYNALYTSGSQGPNQTRSVAGTSTISITANGNNRFSLLGNTLSHSNMETHATTDTVTVTAKNSGDASKTASDSESITNSATITSIGFEWFTYESISYNGGEYEPITTVLYDVEYTSGSSDFDHHGLPDGYSVTYAGSGDWFTVNASTGVVTAQANMTVNSRSATITAKLVRNSDHATIESKQTTIEQPAWEKPTITISTSYNQASSSINITVSSETLDEIFIKFRGFDTMGGQWEYVTGVSAGATGTWEFSPSGYNITNQFSIEGIGDSPETIVYDSPYEATNAYYAWTSTFKTSASTLEEPTNQETSNSIDAEIISE